MRAIVRLLAVALPIAMATSTLCAAGQGQGPAAPVASSDLAWVEGTNLRCGIDRSTGLPARIETRVGQRTVSWLKAPVHLVLRNEATKLSAPLTTSEVKVGPQGVSVDGRLELLSLNISERWSPTPSGVTWDLEFRGNGKRAGHEVALELPILSPDSQLFTPATGA